MKTHVSVLTEEVIEALAINEASTIVDATLGSSGHAQKIVKALGSAGTFVGIDADAEAIEGAHKILRSNASLHLETGNFKNITSILDSLQIEKVDGILADLGWRMEQFGGNGRGFSFKEDEPLIMTFGDPKDYSFVAKDIVNEWAEKDIANVLKGYGEERFSRKIAGAIVKAREAHTIETTFELVEVIKSAVPGFYRNGRLHPATKTFQALRIAVNDEFTVLEDFITQSIERLAPQGRLVIISFHSLEDRIVKHLFRSYAHDQYGVIHTKKPITVSDEELAQNPRARSAKLRIFEKA